MSDENVGTDVSDDATDVDVESDPAQLRAELERWKKEAKKAFDKRDKQAQRLAEFEKREREAAEALAREKNDFAKLEKMLRDDHDATSKELEQLRGQIAEAEKAKRASAFIDAIMAAGGLQAEAKALVHGLLLLEERNGEDIAPTENVESRAKAMLKKLRQTGAPLFQPKSVGPSGTPGVPQDSGPDGQLAQAIASLNRGKGR